jgi:hypothetical protein
LPASVIECDTDLLFGFNIDPFYFQYFCPSPFSLCLSAFLPFSPLSDQGPIEKALDVIGLIPPALMIHLELALLYRADVETLIHKDELTGRPYNKMIGSPFDVALVVRLDLC